MLVKQFKKPLVLQKKRVPEGFKMPYEPVFMEQLETLL
jgi:hypothetical protein